MMGQEKHKRLAALLRKMYGPRWHAGRTVGRTLYCGDGDDHLVGVMDSRPLAEMVILALEYAQAGLDNGDLGR